MSFPRFRQHKHSGIDWIPVIPADWRSVRTKEVVSFTTGWTPPTGDSASYEGENLWANISDLGPRQLLDTAKRVSDGAVETSRLKPSPKGSLLFSFKLSVGQVSFAGRDMFTNEAIATFHPSPLLHLGFAYYALPLFLLQNAEENIYGAKLLNQELIRSAKFPLPTFEAQAAIASFLDWETRKIDELVEEQRQLIALLDEKRQAVISHAVTKGLKPGVPLKASGFESIGEIPLHWEVLPLKRDSTLVTSGSRGWAEHYADDGALFLRIANLTRASICLDLTDTQRVSVPAGSEGTRTMVQPGDVLFSITANLGSVAVVPHGIETAFVSQHLALARLQQARTLPRWVGFVALSAPGKAWFAMQGYGGAKVQLSLDDVREMPIPTPPLTEQRELVAHIEHVAAAVDSLAGEALRAIELLLERRSALITAAVTGQIDVRALASTEAP